MSYLMNGLLFAAACKITAKGLEYVGSLSHSETGRTCQRWDSQSPHNHSYSDVSKFPEDELSAARNYCRNPSDAPEGLWCYTVDPDSRWEWCNIKACDEC